jgi:hypothetical protein
VRIIDRFADRGWSAPKADFRVTAVSVRTASERGAVVEVKTSDAGYVVIDRGGTVVDRIAARRTHVDLSMVVLPNGAWTIANEIDLRG